MENTEDFPKTSMRGIFFPLKGAYVVKPYIMLPATKLGINIPNTIFQLFRAQVTFLGIERYDPSKMLPMSWDKENYTAEQEFAVVRLDFQDGPIVGFPQYTRFKRGTLEANLNVMLVPGSRVDHDTLQIFYLPQTNVFKVTGVPEPPAVKKHHELLHDAPIVDCEFHHTRILPVSAFENIEKL